jgi:hypothetical protein
VTLRDLSIVRGYSGNEAGGGIVNRGQLTIVDSDIDRHTSFWSGGAILNLRRLTLVGSTVTRNFACVGAGIWNRGRLTVTDGVVAGNDAEDTELCGRPRAGGIMNEGILALEDSRVSGNQAILEGGGIWNSAGGKVSLLRSIVTRNEAWNPLGNGGGGGLWNHGALTLLDSVVRDNVVSEGDDRGGGIWNDEVSGSVTLDAASSVTDNIPDDCVGTPAC